MKLSIPKPQRKILPATIPAATAIKPSRLFHTMACWKHTKRPLSRVFRRGLLHTKRVSTQTESIKRLLAIVAPARQRLVEHPLYREIRDIQHLRIFLQSHVFAVWDFMSLLKSLKAFLRCLATPGLPSTYPKSRRIINEIVLAEESDNCGIGYISHFELYLQA